MRRKFSERYGLKKVRDTFQIDNIDNALRNRIWNRFRKVFIDSVDKTNKDIYGRVVLGEDDYSFFENMYDSFFKENNAPNKLLISVHDHVKSNFLQMQWYEIYDFIEYIAEWSSYKDDFAGIVFKKGMNLIFEEEMSGYRFVDSYITPIVDEIEIHEIEEVFNIDQKYQGAKRHLSKALELLSDRENPDYVNSIKESITAVESVAKVITGKNTDLANCLKAMNIDLNKQFKTAMSNLYGWTCKEDGIRHGHTGEELKTSFEEAKYMLVTCSAFINYLIAKKGTDEIR